MKEVWGNNVRSWRSGALVSWGRVSVRSFGPLQKFRSRGGCKNPAGNMEKGGGGW